MRLAALRTALAGRTPFKLSIRSSHSPKRHFGSYDAYNPLPPVRVFGPTLWAITAIGVFYLGCAGYEVRKDVEAVRGRLRSAGIVTPTYEQVEAVKSSSRGFTAYSRSPSGSAGPQQSGADKVVLGLIGLNTGLFAICKAAPSLLTNFIHVPVNPINYTLLTSMFGHAGLFHLGANMYGLYSFGPRLAQTSTFQRSGSHLAAFYLSSGVLASLASHLTSTWPAPRSAPRRLVGGLGASGAVFALVGAWAFLHPEQRIGIIFLPGSLPAHEALMGWALFEMYGLLVGFKNLHLGHAAHLAGLGIGTAYVKFDGQRRIWQPARRFMFSQMQRLKMV